MHQHVLDDADALGANYGAEHEEHVVGRADLLEAEPVLAHEARADELVPRPADEQFEDVARNICPGKRAGFGQQILMNSPRNGLALAGSRIQFVGTEHEHIEIIGASCVQRALEHIRLEEVVDVENGQVLPPRNIEPGVPGRTSPSVGLGNHDDPIVLLRQRAQKVTRAVGGPRRPRK